MIYVVNKYKHKSTTYDVYIGRGSALGNPFVITNKIPRKVSIGLYRVEFYQMLKHKVNNKLKYEICKQELNKILYMHKKGIVNLVCYCAPLICHGDVIKEFILNQRGEYETY